MLYEYGKAVVKERTNPRELAELSKYLRMEYGEGTGPGYILAGMADGGRLRRPKEGLPSTSQPDQAPSEVAVVCLESAAGVMIVVASDKIGLDVSLDTCVKRALEALEEAQKMQDDPQEARGIP